MPLHPKADPYCPCCQGVGETIENERIIDGEYWCSWVGCYCVPITPIRKEILERLGLVEPV